MNGSEIMQGNKIGRVRMVSMLINMASAPTFAYLSLYFSEIGLSTSEISLILGIPTFIAVIGQFVLFNIADKVGNPIKVIFFTIFCTICAAPAFIIADSFYMYFVITAINAIMVKSFMPLSDSYALYYAQSVGAKYGTIRMMGSIGYLICVLICGWLADINIQYIFYVTMAVGVIALFVLASAPKVKINKMKKAAFNPMVLLKRPTVIIMFIAILPIYFSFGFNVTFFAPYVVGELGASNSIVGYAIFFSIAGEVLFLMSIDKLVAKFGIKPILIVLCIFVAARWYVYSVSDNITVLLLLYIIEGSTSVIPVTLVCYYFKSIAPKEGQMATQSIVTIVANGIYQGLGILLASFVISVMGGMANAYAFMSVAMVATVVILIFIPMKLSLKKAE